MRLAFVHGINNQDNTADSIREDWWRAIVDGWSALGLTPKQRPEIDVGYYADVLANAVAGRESEAIAQGGDNINRSGALEFLRAYQNAAAISDEDLARELANADCLPEVVEQGRLQEFLVDTAAALERIIPDRGKSLAKKYLEQAGHYIEDKGLAAQIGLIVRNAIFDGKEDPVVVVSHSLGTVVSYKLLSDGRQNNQHVPLFLTLGSPLGIGMMSEILPVRASVPIPPIDLWVNGYRNDDFVTLDRPLEKNTLGFDGILNIDNGLIEEDDKHSALAYLKSPPICALIHSVLR